MSTVILHEKVSDTELITVKKDYGEYIKVVVDVEKKLLAAGGEWHADAEKELLQQGSHQKNLWGGGIDVSTGQIDYVSLINTRPNLNNSQEVADKEIREQMELVIRHIFSDYVK